MISASVDRRLAAPLGLIRRLAPIVGLALLFAIAIGFERSQDAQFAVSQMLSATVRHGVAEGDLLSLAQAGIAFALWAAWLLARQLAFFAAFLLLELLLIGPPKSWRVAGFALAVQMALGLFYYFGSPALNAALPLPLGVGPLISIEQARLEAVLGPMAQILLALAALLVFDFVGYWVHRAQHAIPILWRIHAVHHSIEDVDSLNSYSHPLDLIGGRVGMVALSALIGFSYDTMLWILALGYIHERILHTRAPVNFGWLGWALVDNRFHFLHHTVDAGRAGRNFGANTTFFDHVFGTYQAPHPRALAETGLGDKSPPKTLLQFFLCRLDDRGPIEAAPAPAELSLAPRAGLFRRSA